MDILTWVFGGAFVVALLTGEAYFRGPVRKDDDPRQYWVTMACYAVLALLVPVLAFFKD